MPISACILSQRGVLRLEGEDRFTFLQGIISNDMALCTPEASIYATLLTPQGKFLHDMFIYNRGDFYLIDCEAARADDLMQRLLAYKLRAKISLQASIDYEVIAYLELTGELPDPRLPALGSRNVIEKGKIPAGYQIVEPSIYDQHRLKLGVPEGSRDMGIGKSTLSDGNIDLLNGISWTKGCYIGQELTARMHHRALVKKRMFAVKISGITPASGAIIFNGSTEVGEMRSSNGEIGLALLNIDQAKKVISDDTSFASETAKLKPIQPDWLKI